MQVAAETIQESHDAAKDFVYSSKVNVNERGVQLTKYTLFSHDGVLMSVIFRHEQVMHRDYRDGPAKITFYPDGGTRTIEYWEHGQRSCMDGAAFIEYGQFDAETNEPIILSIMYAYRGKYTNPSHLQCEGDRRYPLRTVLQWSNEPALTFRNDDGSLAQVQFYENGVRHCTRGPAVVHFDGPDHSISYVKYYLDGTRVTAAEWGKRVGCKPDRCYRRNHFGALMPGSYF